MPTQNFTSRACSSGVILIGCDQAAVRGTLPAAGGEPSDQTRGSTPTAQTRGKAAPLSRDPFSAWISVSVMRERLGLRLFYQIAELLFDGIVQLPNFTRTDQLFAFVCVFAHTVKNDRLPDQ